MAIDLWQGIVNGFSSGLGVGIANYLILKRLEMIEARLRGKKE